MTITEIREKIFADNDYVVTELDKLITHYNLKHTPRWDHDRQQDEVESVAEHIFGLHVLTSYFLPLVEEAIDAEKVRQIITWHDSAEALVGDMTSRTKTETHKLAEKEAEATLIKEAPSHIKEYIKETYETFDAKSTPEARFVKALDKIEPLFHMYFLNKKSDQIASKFNLGWTADVYREYRNPHVSEFSVVKRFDDVLYSLTDMFHPSS